MKRRILGKLEEHGYPGRIVSTGRLAELRREFEGHREKGDLLEDLDRDEFSRFSFEPPAELPDARSLIVVAAPQLQFRFTFHRNGTARRFLVPPTYIHGKETIRRVEALLSAIVEPEGFRVVHAWVPEKLLAVRSGLAAYGRNNITFVPGMGSFYRPVPFFSDLPSPRNDWRKPRMLGACRRCTACRRHCPSGAIDEDRFLLHVDRCITYHNEKPTGVPFPDWMDPGWHECLVGCLHCQRSCPENRRVVEWVKEGAEFTEEETRALLEGTPVERMPAATVEKLERWDLIRRLDVLPRNLRAIVERTRS